MVRRDTSNRTLARIWARQGGYGQLCVYEKIKAIGDGFSARRRNLLGAGVAFIGTRCAGAINPWQEIVASC